MYECMHNVPAAVGAPGLGARMVKPKLGPPRAGFDIEPAPLRSPMLAIKSKSRLSAAAGLGAVGLSSGTAAGAGGSVCELPCKKTKVNIPYAHARTHSTYSPCYINRNNKD